MLIIKICVNLDQIDEIGLINTGHVKRGKHLYRFRNPSELNEYEIYHRRSDPWYILVEKALKICKKHYADRRTRVGEF